MSIALVIDDELDICLMITEHLQHLNFETHYAQTVRDAHHQIAASAYELILVDLNLPDGSGFDIINYIKSFNVTSKIIVISAYHNEAHKALSMGANLFIGKPFSMKAINEALKTLSLLPT